MATCFSLISRLRACTVCDYNNIHLQQSTESIHHWANQRWSKIMHFFQFVNCTTCFSLKIRQKQHFFIGPQVINDNCDMIGVIIANSYLAYFSVTKRVADDSIFFLRGPSIAVQVDQISLHTFISVMILTYHTNIFFYLNEITGNRLGNKSKERRKNETTAAAN